MAITDEDGNITEATTTPDAELPEGEEPVETPIEEPSPEPPQAEADEDSPTDAVDALTRGMEKPEPKKKKEPEAAKPEPEPEPEPELDPLNDPIPAELKGKTRERMEKLIERAKEKDDEVVKYRTQHDELLNAVSSTGTDPDEFAQTLDYLRLAHSTNPTERKEALKMIRQAASALALELGEDPGEGDFDPLANFPDLKEAHDVGDITRKHALELVQGRIEKDRAEQAGAKSDGQNVTLQGKESLNELGRFLVNRDGPAVYQAKSEVVLQTIRPILSSVHPSKWRETFQAAYENLKLPESAAKPRAPQPIIQQKAPAGTNVGQPKSALDALNAGIEARR